MSIIHILLVLLLLCLILPFFGIKFMYSGGVGLILLVILIVLLVRGGGL
jgi:hypothetical protein